MRHACTASHQVEFTGTHHNVAAKTVAMPDGAGERPCDRLQAHVRVGEHLHRRWLGSEMVEEAPRTDRRKPALGQGPPNQHAAQPAQRNNPFRQQFSGTARLCKKRCINHVWRSHFRSHGLPQLRHWRATTLDDE